MNAPAHTTERLPDWRFDHINLVAGNPQVLHTFFEGVMGLVPGYRPPFPFPGTWLYGDGQALVHAVSAPSEGPTAGDLQLAHVAFRSDEPASTVIDRVRRSRLPFKVARVPDEQTTQIFVLLPGGLVIELDVLDDGVALDHHYDTDRAAPMGDQF